MKVNGKDYRTVWIKGSSVFLIDQTLLPFEFRIYEAKNYLDTCRAIKNMLVRGALAIEAAAGFAMAQAFLEAPENNFWNYVEKAIVAKEFGVPFYIAAPTSTFDLNCKSGKDIPIEERSEDEVLYQTGLTKDGNLEKILVSAPDSKVFNPTFDVTSAKYIDGIITEKGLIEPNETSIKDLFKNLS